MPVMPILDIAIGLSFLYLLLALLCTTLNEMIAGWLQKRGKILVKGIERLLGDKQLAEAVYQHPLIRTLAANDEKPLPSYIPSDKFALALMDIVTGPNKAASDPQALREAISSDSKHGVMQALTVVLETSDPTFTSDQQKIEAWFNDQMDRVSGWYKRNTQTRVIALAIVVTLACNADTAQVVKTLWTHPAVAAAVVEAAKDRLAKGRPEGESQPMVEYENPNDATASTPINVPESRGLDVNDRAILGELTGWQEDWITAWKSKEKRRSTADWFIFLLLTKLPGWVVTVLAVSLGAPFWFDTLNRFMNIRNAGRAPDEPRDKSTSKARATEGAK